MKFPSGRPALIIISIIIVLGALIAALLGIVFLSDGSPDPGLAQIVQDEYSVPVYLKIVNVAGKNEAYIVPGEVKWDSGHKNLLYNLSNIKEFSLAFVEILVNDDAEALELIMSQSSRDFWANRGYTQAQILREYQSKYMNLKEPYLFSLESGEDDPSEGMVSVNLKRDSGGIHFDLYLKSDSTWKI